jgi:chromate transport protein ChrA
MDTIASFYHENTEVSIAIIVAAIIFLFLRPKEFGKLLIVIAVVAIIAFLVSAVVDVVDKGADKKGQAANRTDKSYSDSEK